MVYSYPVACEEVAEGASLHALSGAQPYILSDVLYLTSGKLSVFAGVLRIPLRGFL